MGQKFFPYKLTEPSVTQQLLTLFPEIKVRYGSKVKIEVEVSMKAKSAEFLKISTFRGIEIGKQDEILLFMSIYCTNATVTKRQNAVTFQMKVQGAVNAKIENFYVLMNVKEAKITGTKLIVNKIGMYDRDYDDFLQLIVDTYVNNINNQFSKKPYDLGLFDHTLTFARMLVQDFRLSPFVQDEFIYAGFTYFLDEREEMEDPVYEPEFGLRSIMKKGVLMQSSENETELKEVTI